MTVKHDFRARIQAKASRKAKELLYGSKNPRTNVVAPLWSTNGMLIPYTPAIQVTHTSVEYSQYSLPQTNFDYFAFAKRNSPMLSVTTNWTAQNQAEARYVLAVLHFLRGCTMNYYGRQNGELRGINPPTLLFSAYGPYMYQKVPMLIRNVSFGLDQDVDYISCGTDPGLDEHGDLIQDPNYGIYSQDAFRQDVMVEPSEGVSAPGYASELESHMARSYVPAAIAMFIELVYAPTPAKMRDEFNLEKFKSGQYINDTNEGII